MTREVKYIKRVIINKIFKHDHERNMNDEPDSLDAEGAVPARFLDVPGSQLLAPPLVLPHHAYHLPNLSGKINSA